jgi:soluble lytic murein transglycosylase-like protein
MARLKIASLAIALVMPHALWAAEGAMAPVAASSATAQPKAASTQMSERLDRALAYEHGEGLPKDQPIAAAIYCEAAAGGSAEGAFRLGWMYANGRGVAHDDGTATALFDLAAERGHAYARTARTRMPDAKGLLPDCMRPIEPPPADPVVAEVDEGPDPFLDLSAEKQKIAKVVYEVAPRYGIEPRLALSVIAVESNFNVLARSIKDARGLMQLIPATAERFNVRNAYDLRDNVRGGVAYLRWLLAYYQGHVALAAAAYNAGEGVVDRYRGVPPYPETRAYVKRVMQLFRKKQHPYDPSVVEPSAITARLDFLAE